MTLQEIIASFDDSDWTNLDDAYNACGNMCEAFKYAVKMKVIAARPMGYVVKGRNFTLTPPTDQLALGFDAASRAS